MGWAVGYDPDWRRDIGYGVPATCDHPGCNRVIHRGIAHVCGGAPWGGEDGCGLYFCGSHLFMGREKKPQRCERCFDSGEPFAPKPDSPEWLEWKLTDTSWEEWRNEYPDEVAAAQAALLGARA